MDNSDDRRLISLVLQGNTNAYATLLQRHKDMVFTIALRTLKNYEDAEEITQDTFVKAYQKLNTYEGKAAFSTWLYSIVYHNCISKLRKKRLIVDEIDDSIHAKTMIKSEDNALETMAKNEQKALVKKAVEQLPEEDQFLINHYYSEELSIDELAAITGLNKSNIKVKLFRIRKRLHEMLVNAYSDEFYD